METENKKIRVLVTTAFYPTPDGKRARYYVHSRNLYYIKNGIEVVVLNFDAKHNYIIDGIKVITLAEYEKSYINQNFNILLCHAANLRNHYKFLKKYDYNFPKIMFFYHGHEILHLKKYYPAKYAYIKKRKLIRDIFQNQYDTFKIHIWKKYIIKNITKLELVFVSNWIYKQFLLETKLPESYICNKKHIINNSVGKIFEENSFDISYDKIYDFITIRNYLDESTYCADIITNIANNNKQYKFCIIGKGEFFNYYKKPDNMVWINKELPHEEILKLLNKSKCALMPTREDTQGLMACEMATYGMPLITSDISVCKEVFKDFDNVQLINNKNPEIINVYNKLKLVKSFNKNEKYFAKNTVLLEVKLFENLISKLD